MITYKPLAKVNIIVNVCLLLAVLYDPPRWEVKPQCCQMCSLYYNVYAIKVISCPRELKLRSCSRYLIIQKLDNLFHCMCWNFSLEATHLPVLRANINLYSPFFLRCGWGDRGYWRTEFSRRLVRK